MLMLNENINTSVTDKVGFDRVMTLAISSI